MSAGPGESLAGYASRLEASGAHSEAALEYRRLLFFARSTEDSLEARRGMLRTLEASGVLREAHLQVQGILAQEADPEKRTLAEWDALRLLSALDETAAVRAQALGMLDSAPSPAHERQVLRVLAGLGIAESDAEEARRWAQRLARTCPASPSGWVDSLHGLLSREPPRSPLLARILSAVLPGAGQAYAGEPAGGLNSLLLVAMTAYGFVHGLDQGRVADMFLYLALAERFYVGGIKVAGARAEDANLAWSKEVRRRALDLLSTACRDAS